MTDTIFTPAPAPTVKVNKAFSLTFAHIGKLADLEARTGENASELIRQAIDLLYASKNTTAADPTTEPTK